MQTPEARSLRPIPAQPRSSAARQRLEGLWLLLVAAFLVATLLYLGSGDSCAFLATDFRGYYASARIALDHGFDRVYDQGLQNAAQDALPLRCLARPPALPLLHVSMPYLPAFVLLFLPLTALDFTTSYLLISLLNLLLMAAYLLRFSAVFGLWPGATRLLAWMACLPLLATLSLGQVNIIPLVCLGEFILAFGRGKPFTSGLWLACLLVKPYLLVLLLPGLALGRHWRVLLGFGAGLLVVLVCSLLLAGLDGVIASLELAFRFAGPLIQTGPTMMNWRALALNLLPVLPGWAAWGLAIVGMLAVTVLALRLWQMHPTPGGTDFLYLMLATFCATFALSWHSHFYLLILLIPILLVMDSHDQLPPGILATWAFMPLGAYLLVYLVQPNQARNLLGLGYLGLNLIFFTWAIRHLAQDSERQLS